jgi:hypothetical protein
VVIVLDDAHWVDPASASALLFVLGACTPIACWP